MRADEFGSMPGGIRSGILAGALVASSDFAADRSSLRSSSALPAWIVPLLTEARGTFRLGFRSANLFRGYS